MFYSLQYRPSALHCHYNEIYIRVGFHNSSPCLAVSETKVKVVVFESSCPSSPMSGDRSDLELRDIEGVGEIHSPSIPSG